MKIETKNIDDLKPYPHNPKLHPPEQIEKIAQSIKEFGFLVPILIDAGNNIIAGHGRLLAARKLGFVEIPTICADHLSNAQIRAYRIADNKLTESAWDMELLESEIAALQDLNFDIDLTGFDDIEIGELFTDTPEPEDFDAESAIEDESPPIVQTGELWILGDHRLLCGDSTKSEDVERLMGGKKADMVFTDPPYNIGFKYEHYNDKKRNDEYLEFCRIWFNNIQDIKKIIITPGPRNLSIWYDIKEPRDTGIWVKTNSRSGASLFHFRLCEPIIFYGDFKNKRNNDLFEYSRSIDSVKTESEKNNNVENVAPAKPVKLIMDLLQNYSKNNQIILDLFGGSGTTLIACEQLNRRCYMCEISEKYCGVILDRWANYTKEDPIREDGMKWSELKESQQH